MFARIDADGGRLLPERAIASSPAHVKSPIARRYYMLFMILTPVYEPIEKRYVQAATVNAQTRIACALERFRLTRNAFPESLSELTPEFLNTVPIEIVSGAPFQYRRLPSLLRRRRFARRRWPH